MLINYDDHDHDDDHDLDHDHDDDCASSANVWHLRADNVGNLRLIPAHPTITAGKPLKAGHQTIQETALHYTIQSQGCLHILNCTLHGTHSSLDGTHSTLNGTPCSLDSTKNKHIWHLCSCTLPEQWTTETSVKRASSQNKQQMTVLNTNKIQTMYKLCTYEQQMTLLNTN